jgi:hypothetical protein
MEKLLPTGLFNKDSKFKCNPRSRTSDDVILRRNSGVSIPWSNLPGGSANCPLSRPNAPLLTSLKKLLSSFPGA